MTWPNERTKPMRLSWLLPSALTAALVSGCATAPKPSGYQVILPELEAPPREFVCQQAEQERLCTAVLSSDWQKVVRKLKAACLAQGGSPEACRTEQAGQ